MQEERRIFNLNPKGIWKLLLEEQRFVKTEHYPRNKQQYEILNIDVSQLPPSRDMNNFDREEEMHRLRSPVDKGLLRTADSLHTPWLTLLLLPSAGLEIQLHGQFPRSIYWRKHLSEHPAQCAAKPSANSFSNIITIMPHKIN